MIFDYVLVVILTILAGAWSLPAGISFGLDPLGVYVAAVLGGLLYAVLILVVGGRAGDAFFDRYMPDARKKVADGRAGRLLQDWGLPGLGLVGPLLLGPTVTLVAAILLGADRRRFAVWYVLSVVVGFAVFTVFWAAVL